MSSVKYGLVGKDIAYSFSRGYFKEKFEKLQLENYKYVNFDLQQISELEQIIQLKEGGFTRNECYHSL